MRLITGIDKQARPSEKGLRSEVQSESYFLPWIPVPYDVH